MNNHRQATSIRTPPDSVPDEGPVNSVASVLPFGGLTWENFERLCHRLASQDDDVEHSARYGRAGQAQQGIDIFVRKRNGKYDTWQAKRYKQYSVNDLRKAVSAFLNGNWVARTETLFIAVQASLADTRIQDEIETQTASLKLRKLSLVVLGGDELSERVRNYPRIVLDFFGRPWAKAFFGDVADQELLDTLDGAEVARVRSQLAKVYVSQFQQLDRGVIESDEFSNGPFDTQERGLLARFIRPDILVRELRGASVTPRDPENVLSGSPSNSTLHDSEYSDSAVEWHRRIPLDGWLKQTDQLALLGDAGTGKSTVLRCLALDLIGDQAVLPEIAERWGSLIPVFVSFAKWTRVAENAGGQIGLKDVIRASLQPLLTADLVGFLDRAIDEHRILLLVDGLDEWSNEQAARTTLQTLLTFVATHQIPVVVTARPRGLNKIGRFPSNWSTGTLAPLSGDQQRQLVLRCLGLTLPDTMIPVSSIDPLVNQVVERFFRDLQRESGLANLAEIPLLLVSLLALSLRRITLPRKKAQALDLLIDILLDIHPQGRATAAGDVQGRFKFAQDIDIRKGAVAALAFGSREDGGDAGYPISKAKQRIRDFLTDPDTHAFGREKAVDCANEMLAVNAETIGLLVEKGPSDVGFVHASLEEYLAALHIQGWQLDKLVAFIRAHATNVRWRNVIGNLISITKRPAEIDQFVAAIESTDSDVLGESARNQLLADIAFAPSRMSPATATRLGLQSLALIESPGAVAERIALLSSALNGTNHPVLGSILMDRVKYWAPKRLGYAEQLFEALGSWDQASDLLAAFKRGLVEQSRWGQRPAARAMAKVYGGCDEVRQWLMGVLNGTTDLQSTGAAIEALVLGWPSMNGLDQIIADAQASSKPELHSTGIWAAVQLGLRDDGLLSELLDLLGESRRRDFWDQSLAWEALSTAWLNHPVAIDRCLLSIGDRDEMPRRDLDLDQSIRFLLACTPENQRIRTWIVNELAKDHPFPSVYDDWGRLAPFALVDDSIRELLVAAITNEKNAAKDYLTSHLIASLNDERLKNYAIRKVSGSGATWSQSWYLPPLVEGWSSSPDVQALLDEVRGWSDVQLVDLVGLLPKILPDRRSCRDRLLAICRSRAPNRAYAFVEAFLAAGCDWTDEEVVEELIKIASSRTESDAGWDSLIRGFGASPLVQRFARDRLVKRTAPIAGIAAAYPHVPDLRSGVLSRVGALPTSLRYVVAEVASIDSENHPAMADVLNRYDWEVDGDIKVLLSVRHHELLRSSQEDARSAIDSLLSDVRSIGPDLGERRAAAVAGLITLDAIKEFTALREDDKPLAISVGSFFHQSGTLLELVARRWDELKDHLGERLIERVGRNSVLEDVWDLFAPYLSSNDTLRQEFINYCELADPSALGFPSLRALARERPRSDLLMRHCVSTVGTRDGQRMRSTWEDGAMIFEAARILRDQFGAKPEISRLLHDGFIKRQDTWTAMVLAIYDPSTDVLKTLEPSPLTLGAAHRKWAIACTISASSQGSVEFVEVVRAMVNRDSHNLWDLQNYTNIAVLERLARDPRAVEMLLHALSDNLTNSETASLSRYLASIGPFDDATFASLRRRLDFFSRKRGVVIAGYDALANEIRPVSHSLMDALQ